MDVAVRLRMAAFSADGRCVPTSKHALCFAFLFKWVPGYRNPAADCTLFGGSLRKSPKCCKALYPFNLRKEARKDAGQKQGVFRSIMSQNYVVPAAERRLLQKVPVV